MSPLEIQPDTDGSSQHYDVPELSLLEEITHVELAFMHSEIFNQDQPSTWPLFTTVEAVRQQFAPGTAIMVAIGGWGDTNGFSEAAATELTRKRFAQNVRAMVDATGADGQSSIPRRDLSPLILLQVWTLTGNTPGK